MNLKRVQAEGHQTDECDHRERKIIMRTDRTCVNIED